MFRWSEGRTLKFVSEYLTHECLWNYNSPQYRNKEARQLAFDDLERAMNIPKFGENEIKLKIKYLRSTYSQELKKIRDSKKNGSGPVYVPALKWFHLLNDSLRSIDTEGRSGCISTSRDSTDEENKSIGGDVDPGGDSTFREYRPPVKRQKRSRLHSVVNELKGIADNMSGPAEENEFEVFGKHVGLQLKSLPLLLALEAQEHIQIYLNGIRRNYLQNPSDSIIITKSSPSPYCDSQDSP